MKGFGFQAEKQAIAKAIRSRNLKQAQKLMAQLEHRLSVQDVAELLMQVLSTLSADDVNWASEHLIPDDIYEEIDEQVVMTLYETLVSQGFRAGRDFSLNEQGFVMSQQAHDALLPSVPEEYRETFSSEMVKIQSESPVEVLERQLGVPFVDNLIQQIEQRLPSLSDLEASMYLFNIATGVENRTGIAMMEILIGHFGEDQRFSRVFNLIQQGKSAENSDWIYDLVISAGGVAEIHPDPNDSSKYILTPRSMELLDSIYLGSRPIAPLLTQSEPLDED